MTDSLVEVAFKLLKSVISRQLYSAREESTRDKHAGFRSDQRSIGELFGKS